MQWTQGFPDQQGYYFILGTWGFHPGSIDVMMIVEACGKWWTNGDGGHQVILDEVAPGWRDMMFMGPIPIPDLPVEHRHHVWCNGQSGPVKTCSWCADRDGKPGLLKNYPMGDCSEENLVAEHFPGVKRAG